MLSKVITISQQKGGTGKTTLAVHLAMAFIKYHNLKVAIIDTDPQGSLGKWFMIRAEKKVSNENLTFKTASLWGAQYESKTLKPSIEAADLVLIPMAASHVDFWATGAIVEIAQKANKKILVQINRSSQRSKLMNKTNDFIKSLNLISTKTIIGNRQIYTSSMGEGKTAVEKQKKGSAVEEIKNLSEQIILELQ